MKVCILTTSFPAYPGDTQSPFIYRFAKSLVDNKVDVEVVCPFYRNSLRSSENYNGIKIRRFKYFLTSVQTLTDVGSIPDAIKNLYGKIQLPFFCFSYLFSAFRHGKKADIVHAQWVIPSAFIGVFLKVFYGKPLIATTRGTELVLSSKSFIWRQFLKYTIKRCDYLVSNNFKHLEIFNKFGVNENKIIHIPNGLDYFLYKKRDKRIIRKKLGFSYSEKIILFVGHLIKIKRVDVLIGIFKKILKQNSKTRLIIVGDGPLRNELNSLVNNFGLKSKVQFMGSVNPEMVALYYNAADVFVLTSSSEGRPNVVLEAMASGLPVVTTNVGDVGGIIKDGNNGFIVNVDDISAFAEKLEKLLSNKKLLEKFSHNGFETVRKFNPSWKDAGDQYIQLYGRV